MLGHTFRITIIGLLASTVVGCGSVPVFLPNQARSVGIREHLQARIETDARQFSVRSGGEIVGARKSPQLEPWSRIAKFSTSHFAIAFFAPEKEAVVFDTTLRTTIDVSSGERGMSDLESLHASFQMSNHALLEMLGARTVKSRVNIFYSRPDAPVQVPWTVWQSGPIVDPVELNLAIIMPLGQNGKSLLKPEDRARWHAEVVGAAVHEYMHVIQLNSPTPARPPLADEFVAHTVSDCNSMVLRGKFTEASRRSAMEVAEEYFQKGKQHYLDQPFALSDTASDLASLAASLLYARPELKSASLAVWQQVAPAYCKYIANVVPDFSTVEGALDWIDTHVYRANLDFLGPSEINTDQDQ